jgi:hypothetical protein
MAFSKKYIMITTKVKDQSSGMKTMQDLELRLNESINILQKARDFFARCKSFFNSSLSTEEKSLIKNLPIIKDAIHAFWVITVLELCKLADDSPSQKHNISKLIRDIWSDWHTLNLDKILTIKELREVESKINSTITSDRILSIKRLRDKYYAHTDINNPNPEVELIPNFNKIDALIKDLEKVLIDLKSKLLKTTYVFVPVYQEEYLILKDLLIGINQNKLKK